MTNARNATGGLLIVGLWAVLRLCAPATGAELRFSGVLGQSQPVGTSPLSTIGMHGAACDAAGGLWSFSDDGVLLRFHQKNGAWLLAHTAKPPSPLGIGTVQKTGATLTFAGADGGIYAYSPDANSFQRKGTLPEGTVAFHAPESGAPVQSIVLTENAIRTLTATETQWRTRFTLQPLKSGRYYSVCIEPGTGNVLVGSSYPDMTVRCFNWRGNEVLTTLWPRKRVHSEQLTIAGGIIWALSNRAVALSSRSEQEIGGAWTGRARGLARTIDGCWWLATTQGLIGYSTQGESLDLRIGGLSRPKLVTVSPETMLFAYDSGRMLGIAGAADPTTPLACRFQESFRAGGDWKSHAVSMQHDGLRYLVLDDVAKRLWAFHPEAAGTGESAWRPLTSGQAFVAPRAVAAGGGQIFVSDGNAILSRRHSEDGAFVKLPLSTDGPLAATPAGKLLLVSDGALAAYSADASGTWQLLWKCEAPGITALAGGEEIAVVVNRAASSVAVYSVLDGTLLAVLAANKIPGGITPSSVCVREPWVFVGDEAGNRIVRLRYRQ